MASQRLLLQLVRLGESAAGKALLRRLRLRVESRIYAALNTLSILYPQRRKNQHRLEPPWSFESLECQLTIPGIRSKRYTPVAEARMLALEHLDRSYRDCVHVFTDGSVDREADTSAAAFVIPGMNVSWAARIDQLTSSTTAECIAIEAALKKIKSLRVQHAVILTDSKSALQLLQLGFPADKTCQRSLRLLQQIKENGFCVRFQWVPSHVGVLGNEAADQLAREATSCTRLLKVAPDERRILKTIIQDHFRSLWRPQHRPCVTKGMKRTEATLLFRIRTNSARTPAWLHKLNIIASPLCGTCGATGDIGHFIMDCREHAEERLALFKELRRMAAPHASLNDLIFPEGHWITRRDIFRLILQFLRVTSLSESW